VDAVQVGVSRLAASFLFLHLGNINKTQDIVIFDFFNHLKIDSVKIKYFSENEDSYRELGIPWCMGILLHGKPGTGKTSCIKAIASMTQRHIVDIALSKIKTQKELTDLFYCTKINGADIPFHKRLYILDELDLIINKIKDRKLKDNDNTSTDIKSIPTNNQDIKNINNLYKNYNQGINYSNYNNQNNYKNIDSIQTQNPNNSYLENDYEGVTLEHLLTIMDGTVEHSGSMFIATTNYIDLIDKALTRPGRFDVCLYLDNANDEIIYQIIKHFASKHSKNNSKNNLKNISKNISQTNSNTNSKKKLTSKHKELISKYSTFEGKNIWSPAKISQICLTYIDSEYYYDNIIESLKRDYEEQCKLL
jgi:SpoVK/Ycf46/Vps4 family AAA+-type ATPase